MVTVRCSEGLGLVRLGRDLRSFEIRFEFESAVRFDSIRKGLADSKIFEKKSAVPTPLLVVSLVKRLKPLTTLSGTVYRLASSMTDHTPAAGSLRTVMGNM